MLKPTMRKTFFCVLVFLNLELHFVWVKFEKWNMQK